MSVHYEDDAVTVHHGDCLDVLRELAADSVDAVVCDPPYGLGFMGKAWDANFIDSTIERRRRYPGDPSPKAGENGGFRSAAAEAGRYDLSLRGNRAFGAWCEQWATECLRILRPGGYLLAFGGTRTWHRLAAAVEDAGFEIRDTVAWLHGQGFPKGKGQLKPAFEPVVVGRKRGPIRLNVDACRTPVTDSTYAENCSGDRGHGGGRSDVGATNLRPGGGSAASGRWPTNVVLDGEVADELDRQSGTLTSGIGAVKRASSADQRGNIGAAYGAESRPEGTPMICYGDSGGASRYFPVFRPPCDQAPHGVASDCFAMDCAGRGCAVEEAKSRLPGTISLDDLTTSFRYEAKAPTAERPRHGETAHPTVKPLDLMRWLVRLVTPPGGTVLDPFAGSGTTAEACVIEGFRCITVEREAAYLPLILARLSKPIQPDLFGGAA